MENHRGELMKYKQFMLPAIKKFIKRFKKEGGMVPQSTIGCVDGHGGVFIQPNREFTFTMTCDIPDMESFKKFFMGDSAKEEKMEQEKMIDYFIQNYEYNPATWMIAPRQSGKTTAICKMALKASREQKYWRFPTLTKKVLIITKTEAMVKFIKNKLADLNGVYGHNIKVISRGYLNSHSYNGTLQDYDVVLCDEFWISKAKWDTMNNLSENYGWNPKKLFCIASKKYEMSNYPHTKFFTWRDMENEYKSRIKESKLVLSDEAFEREYDARIGYERVLKELAEKEKEETEMSERVYFKKKSNKSKFMELCEKLGADYYENGFGIFKCDYSMDEGYRMAIRITEDGDIELGITNPSCDNFESGTECNRDLIFDKKESKWLLKTLKKILAPKKKKPKR